MSRSYAIRLPIEILMSNAARDKMGTFSMGFPLLDILPIEQMRQILREKLLAAGFTDTPDGLSMPVAPEQTAVLNPDTMIMTLTVPVPDSFELKVEEEYMGQLKNNIKAALAEGGQVSLASGDRIRNAIGQNVAENMKNLALEARKQVNTALKETYRDAIKEKASTIGTVSNVSETVEGKTYRIRVEISE